MPSKSPCTISARGASPRSRMRADASAKRSEEMTAERGRRGHPKAWDCGCVKPASGGRG